MARCVAMNTGENRSTRTACLLLAAWCLLLFAPGLFALPVVDRDEARFAQATRQMFEARDFVRIRFQSEARHKKPIGIHWLQAGALVATGNTANNAIWPYRLPSLLGALLAVLGTLVLGRRLFDPRTALWGAFLTACSLLLVVEAQLATTDAMLLASIVAAQGALGAIYLRRQSGETAGRGPALLFYVAHGFGLLLKGPIPLMISGLTVLTLLLADRRARWLQDLYPLWGLPLLAVIVCPWALAIGVATDWAFYRDAVGTDLLPKLAGGQESHGFWPGYYLLLSPLIFWPISFLFLPALAGGWQSRREAGVRFCLAWTLPTWLVFELIPTKLPHYVLPVLPALALLAGRVVTGVDRGPKAPFAAFWMRCALLGWALLGMALAGAVVVLPRLVSGRWEPLAALPAAAALAVALWVARCAWCGAVVAAARAAVVGSLCVFVPLTSVILPGADDLWLSRSILQALERHAGVGGVQSLDVAASGYHEPSLVFLLGTPTRLVSPEAAASFWDEHPQGWVLTSDSADPAFRGKLRATQRVARLVESFRGFHYAKGKWVTLRLYRAPPTATAENAGGAMEEP